MKPSITDSVNDILAYIDKTFTDNMVYLEESVYDLMIVIFQKAIALADRSKDPVGIFYETMVIGEEIWESVFPYMWENKNIKLDRLSFLFSMEMFSRGDSANTVIDPSKEKTEYAIPQMHTAICNYADSLLSREDKSYDPVLTDEELEEYMNAQNSCTLKEFFSLFQSLGKVESDPSKYTTTEEREKYEKMMVLYKSLISK